MLSRILPLAAVLLTVPVLAACATGNPNAKMGPEWARYVGSSYRRTYGATSGMTGGHLAASARPSATGSGASALTAAADLPLERPTSRPSRGQNFGPVAVPIPPRRPNRPAMTVGSAASNVRAAGVSNTGRTVTPTMTPRAPTPPVPGIRPIRTSRHLQGTILESTAAAPAPRTGIAPSASASASAPAPSAPALSAPAPSPVSTALAGDDRTQRQFLRLKIHGLEPSDSEAPFQVRRMLSEAPGVKEVVFSSKTQTAIVVIEPGTDPDDIRAALAAPYRASILR